MENEKGWRWCDIPIGTIYTSKNTETSWVKLSDDEEKCIGTNDINKGFTNNKTIYHNVNWTFQLPHGYNTPLWKVLNGESE